MLDRSNAVGWGEVILRDTVTGAVRVIPFSNLITTAGDQYHAKRIAGVTATAATGMKLGTGTTTPAKSSTGASLVTYLSGSNATFDTGYPTTAAYAGTDTGWVVTYECTWAEGVVTNSAIAELALVNDAATDATSSAANTYARALFSPAVDKAASESMTVIWNQKHLGA